MECPFCKPDNQRIIEERKNVFVILSNPRLMPGHTLVIPKRHVEKLSDLNADEIKELFNVSIEFQDKILNKFSSGCDVCQHNRLFLPESDVQVNHVHIHLRPRELEDELYRKSQIFEKDVWKKLTQEEIDKFSKIFKNG